MALKKFKSINGFHKETYNCNALYSEKLGETCAFFVNSSRPRS